MSHSIATEIDETVELLRDLRAGAERYPDMVLHELANGDGAWFSMSVADDDVVGVRMVADSSGRVFLYPYVIVGQRVRVYARGVPCREAFLIQEDAAVTKAVVVALRSRS